MGDFASTTGIEGTRGRLRCKFFPCRPTLTRIRLLGDLDITSISQIPLWGRCGSTLLGLVTTMSNFSPFGRTSSAGPESMLSLNRLQNESVPRRLGFISTLTGSVRSSLENAAARNLMVRKLLAVLARGEIPPSVEKRKETSARNEGVGRHRVPAPNWDS